MENKLTAKVNLEIHATPSTVWDALTNPAIIKQYLFGTEAISTWKAGDPIVFKGTWNGKPYEDKGTIKKIEKERELQYTYWSSISGIADSPENYMNIRFLLARTNNGTELALTQDNCRTADQCAHSEQNWKMVLNSMKRILEASRK
jgi:uncharacterized protein YndB with AHSA1/START domain